MGTKTVVMVHLVNNVTASDIKFINSGKKDCVTLKWAVQNPQFAFRTCMYEDKFIKCHPVYLCTQLRAMWSVSVLY